MEVQGSLRSNFGWLKFVVRVLDSEKQARCASGVVLCKHLPGLSVFLSAQPEWWDLAVAELHEDQVSHPGIRAQASHRDVCGRRQQLFYPWCGMPSVESIPTIEMLTHPVQAS